MWAVGLISNFIPVDKHDKVVLVKIWNVVFSSLKNLTDVKTLLLADV